MKKITIITVSAVIFLSACSSLESDRATSQRPAAPDTPTVQTERTGGGGGGRTEDQTAAPAQQASLDQAASSQTPPVTVERKIIRNADLRLETGSPEESQKEITNIVWSKNGFVLETNRSTSDAQTTTRDVINMTVRVPAEKFDETLGEIRATGSRVIQENVKGQDVTEEFIDIEARLKAQRALEAQFLEIMKRASSVEDALNVQRQLAQVRGEIEKIEGRKRFLENQAAFSTIKIQLLTPVSLAASPSGFFYELKEALSTGFNAALKFVLFLVTAMVALLPFLLFIVLPIYLLLRYFWRRRVRRRTAERVVREEINDE